MTTAGLSVADKLLAYGDKKLEAFVAAGAELKALIDEQNANPNNKNNTEECAEERLPLELAKSNAAGQCRGICIALFLMRKPVWANPDEVADFLKARYKAKKKGEPIPQPPEAATVVEARANTVASTELGKRAQANADAAGPKKAPAKKAAAKKAAPAAAATPEPADDGSVEMAYVPGDVSADDPGNTDRVKMAIEKARAAKAAAAAQATS